MSLKPGYSRATFEANYREMVRAGHTHDQALAACYKSARDSYFRKFPKGALPYWLRYPNGQRLNTPCCGSTRKKNPSRRDYVIVIAEWVTQNDLGLEVYEKMIRHFEKSPRSYDGGDVYDLYIDAVKPRGKNPVPESSRSARRSKDARIKLAADQYERFTGHEAAELVSVDKPDVPDVMSVIGEIDGVMYTTVRDGEVEKYIHEFKKNCRPLFCVSPDGKQIFMIGGSYDFTERGIVDRT